MSHKTVTGLIIDHPGAHARTLLAFGEAGRTALRAYERIFNALVHIEYDYARLRAENLRLEHENAFMLKLVNDRDTTCPANPKEPTTTPATVGKSTSP